MAFLAGFELADSTILITEGYHIRSPLDFPVAYHDGTPIDSTFLTNIALTTGSTVRLPIALFKNGFEVPYKTIDGTGELYSKPYPDEYKTFKGGDPLFPGSANTMLPGDTAFVVKYGEVKVLITDFIADVVSGNHPLAVNFSDLSIGDPVEWVWDFGDGTHSYFQNPSHTYLSAGHYDVTLTTTSLDGQTNSKTASSYINVSSIKTVRFVNQVVGEPIDHLLWDFGDGSTSTNTDSIVDHVYLLAGDYTATLQAWSTKGSYGSSTKTITVTGTNPPVANFVYSIDVTNYKGVIFSDVSLYTPTSWSWNFGDGSSSSAQSPVHTYANYDSTYSVTLTTINAGGSDSTTKQVITYPDPLPIANFESVTTDRTVAFTDLTLKSPTTWAWNFGDGNYSSAQNPVHIYANYDTTYTVDLTASNVFGSDYSRAYLVTGNAPVIAPDANFSWTIDSTNTRQINFTDISLNNPTAWDWTWGDGSTQGMTQNPSHTYSSYDSTYSVTLNVWNAGGSDSTTKSIVTGAYVTPMPDDLFNLVNDNPYLVAWYPFCETDHTTGYTPNVANQTDGSTLRLALNSFSSTEHCGNGYALFRSGSSTGNLKSDIRSQLQIRDNLTVILTHQVSDSPVEESYMIQQIAIGDTSETNILFELKRTVSHQLNLFHEYGAGVNVNVPTGLYIPYNDGTDHFIVFRRDTSSQQYEIKMDDSSFTSLSYSNNPSNGEITTLNIPSTAGVVQSDGTYRNVMIFNKKLTDLEVATIRSAGTPQASWFNYTNWDNSTGTGYVTYNHPGSTLTINTASPSTQAHQWRSTGPDSWEAIWTTIGKDSFYPCDSHVITYPSMAVPKGSIVTSAIPHYTPPNNQIRVVDSTCNAKLAFTDSGNPSHPSGAAQAQSLVLTSTVPWNDLPSWYANTDYTGPSLHTILQNITDRADWTYGNRVQQVCHDNTSVNGGSRAGYTNSLYNLVVTFIPPYDYADSMTVGDSNTQIMQWGIYNSGQFEATWMSFGNYAPYSNMPYAHSVTFRNPGIPKGSKIISAIPKYTSANNYSNTTCNVNFHFADRTNPWNPTSWNDASSIPLTSPIPWSNIPAWTSGVQYSGPELKTILQTIIDKTDWSLGNNIQMVVRDNTSSNGAYRAANGTGSVGLYVVYSTTSSATDFAPHNMTSNTLPTPYVASASTEYSSQFQAYNAFNGGVGTLQYWIASTNTGWLKLDIGSGNSKKLQYYAIQVNTIPEPARAPRDWTMEGSNDDSTWTTLDTVSSQTAWASGEIRLFACDPAKENTSYRYFRLNVSANNGDTYLEIGELSLYGLV